MMQKRDQHLQEMNGIQRLANAIILQATNDFRDAYKRLKRNPNAAEAKVEVNGIKRFFYSDYFCLLTDLDGPALYQRIVREMEKV